MPHTIADLISSKNLSEADVKATLAAAGLSLEQEQYSDEDIRGKFDVIRSFFNEGKVSNYEEAKELLASRTLAQSIKSKGRKNQKGAPSTLPVNPNLSTASEQQNSSVNLAGQENLTGQQPDLADSPEERLSVTDLLKRVNERLGLTLTLKQVFAIFEASGLPDAEYYTEEQAKHFMLACAVLDQDSPQDLGSRIQEAAGAVEAGLVGLVGAVTSERARHIPKLINQLYMQNVAFALAENQEEVESFFLSLKESIIAGIEGKSPLASIMQVEWTPKSLPESPSLPNPSLPTSESTTTIDTNSESSPND